jgi:hypothetical protein
MRQESSRSLDSDSSFSVAKADLQREAMDLDRRQIRRQLEEKLRERGLDPDKEMIVESELKGVDDETVYEDIEMFPWKQREAAVHAAAIGGRTEGRVEGLDSLERALQSHQHQLHYGRGKGFGWSAQQHRYSTAALIQKQQQINSMRQLTDWTSFRDLSQSQSSGDLSTQEATQEQMDAKKARKRARNAKLLNTIYVLVAIGVVLGFAYYIETVKVGTYETYLPKGYTSTGAVDESAPGQEASDSQGGFIDVSQQADRVAP